MPLAWNEAELENIRIGTNNISIRFERISDNESQLSIEQSDANFNVVLPNNAEMVEGEQVESEEFGKLLKGSKIVVKISEKS